MLFGINKYLLFVFSIAFNIGISIGCSSVWMQCGSQNWSGDSCCHTSTICIYVDKWYSHCLPTTIIESKLFAYCPSASDIIMSYYNDPTNKPKIYNQGWNITNGGGIATKSAYNLLGGSVEYDVDFSRTPIGVNANIYTISPTIPKTGFTKANYCDAQKSDSEWCMELDWIETNGFCGGATTLHTVPGTGNHDCTAWGCASTYIYNGKSKFHMKITYGIDGKMSVYRDDILVSNYSPTPKDNSWNIIAATMESKGAVIYSSIWVGWVPIQNKCGTGGSLLNSQYSISNLRIVGAVVQGPIPKLC